MNARYEFAIKTNEELTALLKANGGDRTVGFEDCSSTTVCRSHAIDKLLIFTGNPEEVWATKNHSTLEELESMGLVVKKDESNYPEDGYGLAEEYSVAPLTDLEKKNLRKL